MASRGPVVNGDLSVDAQSTPAQRLVTAEETNEKMKLLIRENADLKETLQQTNNCMKEKFEELSVWRERQRGVIEFLEGKLEEAKEHISTLTRANWELQRLKKSDGGTQDEPRRREVDTLKTVQVEKLSRELQQMRSDLEIAESTNKTQTDRAMEQEKQQQEKQQQKQHQEVLQQEKQQQEMEQQEKLQQEKQQQEVLQQEKQQQEKLQQEVLQSHRRVEELQKSLAQLQEAYTQLSDENCRMKEEVKKNNGEFSKEEVTALQTRLEAAEKALADKQEKMDGMKQEIFWKEKELETIPVFQAQAEVYFLDFNAERAAREKIHEENELLCNELESVKAENRRLQEELDALASQSLTAIQSRHRPLQGAGPEGGAAAHDQQWARGVMNIPEHTCPKCNLAMPDLDTLQIHIMDCID